MESPADTASTASGAITESIGVATSGIARPASSFAFQPVLDAVQRSVLGYEAQVCRPVGEPAAHVLQQLPMEEVGDFDVDGRRAAIGLASRLGLASDLYLFATFGGPIVIATYSALMRTL